MSTATTTVRIGSGTVIHIGDIDAITGKLLPACGQAPLRAYIQKAAGEVGCAKCIKRAAKRAK